MSRNKNKDFTKNILENCEVQYNNNSINSKRNVQPQNTLL